MRNTWQFMLENKTTSPNVTMLFRDSQHPDKKKNWHQTVSLLREECPKTELGTLTGLFGYSRQSFYNGVKEDEFAENALEPLIVEKARDYRKDNPGLGCAKLYLVIKKLFEQTGCMPGRDAFIELLRQNGLMVQIKRRRHYKTTDSSHHYHKYENLIKEIVPSRPNEIWVSDITYVETEEGVCYLSLITDAYSHMIVGWAVGPTLETASVCKVTHFILKTKCFALIFAKFAQRTKLGRQVYLSLLVVK